ncbi:MAG: aminopeptidase YwaD [Patiriisocius sp.]|jgi:aminopeptidase YwaD
MRYSYILFLLFIPAFSLAQDIDYVRNQAEILSADKMYGRGYVKKGMDKAAKHIASEFKAMGIETFDNSPYQNIEYAVNSFPKKIHITVNDQELISGKDFLLSPESGSTRGTYTAFNIDKAALKDLPHPKDLIGKIVLLDNSGIENKDSLGLFYQLREIYAEHLPVIWVNNDRLIWSVARRKMKNGIIEVNPGLIKEGDEIKIKFKSKWLDDFKTKNVIGYVKGTEFPDSFIVFTGHYDHLGMMGKKACFNGANDNASGVAFLMSMAKYYVNNPSKCSIAFIAFTGEEAGLIGSKYYTQNPIFPLEKIKFLLNMDLLGFGEDGITIVNATLHERAFSILNEINEKEDLLVKIKKRGPAANSDHYWFEEAGVPSFFMYTMGDSKAYHDVYDRYETLTFGEYNDIFKLIRTFIEKL